MAVNDKAVSLDDGPWNGSVSPTLETRFWAKVDKRGDCWLWTASFDGRGYGQIKTRSYHFERAHRVVLKLAGMHVPNDAVVMHTCDTPACVNPSHLRVVTQRENLADMQQKGRHVAWQKHLSHCKRGHPFVGRNLIVQRDGHRNCRTCHNARAVVVRAKKRAA